MSAFESILGDKLLGKSGELSTKEALGGKAAVFVYFSAHWCPPCRGFTPKLAEFYKKHAASKNFEVVFVSSDKDSDQFNEYYGEQPWLALPYNQRAQKDQLSKKFKVQGIPFLVILGPEGQTYTKDGRSKVMGNLDDCAGFPWKPMSLQEALGDVFVRQDASTVGKDAIAGKTLGLYFSAHWCPPCRGFTPVLKKFYEAYKAKDPNFEIIFVSSDKDEEGMLSYFKNDHGSYLALPFAKRTEKEELSSMFGVDGIPTFAVVSADGQIINPNARVKVQSGADAVLKDGWEPPAVGDMAEGPEAAGTDINETPTVVIMCQDCAADKQAAIHAAVEPLAKRYIDEAKTQDKDVEIIFLLAKGGGPMDQLKALVQKDAGAAIAKAGSAPVMLLFDIPDNGAFYLADTNDITTESVENFLKNRGPRKQLSQG